MVACFSRNSDTIWLNTLVPRLIYRALSCWNDSEGERKGICRHKLFAKHKLLPKVGLLPAGNHSQVPL
jgi:hypothetical protein